MNRIWISAVEVQTAPYDLLLRIPGIGPKSAARIVRARRYGSLDFDSMKKMGGGAEESALLYNMRWAYDVQNSDRAGLYRR